MRAVMKLQDLLKRNLEATNWRLMSDGVSYRLGFLQGRLRGMEGEKKIKEVLESEREALSLDTTEKM
jgi:hypothetical protein